MYVANGADGFESTFTFCATMTAVVISPMSKTVLVQPNVRGIFFMNDDLSPDNCKAAACRYA